MAGRTIKTLVAALITLAVMGLLASPATAGKKDDTLNVAWEKELPTLDYYFQNLREGIIVSRHIFDSLLYRDPETWDYKPLLAKSFKWVDELTIEAELREGHQVPQWREVRCR